jgi:phage terminase small subunit
MKVPSHLDRRARGVWREVAKAWPLEDLSPAAVESLCVQVVRMRDAQARVDAEGELVAGARERPEPHPALAIERAAAEQVRKWLSFLRDELPQEVMSDGQSSDPFDSLDELASRRESRTA